MKYLSLIVLVGMLFVIGGASAADNEQVITNAFSISRLCLSIAPNSISWGGFNGNPTKNTDTLGQNPVFTNCSSADYPSLDLSQKVSNISGGLTLTQATPTTNQIKVEERWIGGSPSYTALTGSYVEITSGIQTTATQVLQLTLGTITVAQNYTFDVNSLATASD